MKKTAFLLCLCIPFFITASLAQNEHEDGATELHTSEQASKEGTPRVLCPFCPKRFLLRASMHKHVLGLVHCRLAYPCVCGKKYSSISPARSHRMKCKQVVIPTVYLCCICSFECKGWTDIATHVTTEHTKEQVCRAVQKHGCAVRNCFKPTEHPTTRPPEQEQQAPVLPLRAPRPNFPPPPLMLRSAPVPQAYYPPEYRMPVMPTPSHILALTASGVPVLVPFPPPPPPAPYYYPYFS